MSTHRPLGKRSSAFANSSVPHSKFSKGSTTPGPAGGGNDVWIRTSDKDRIREWLAVYEVGVKCP